MELKQNDFLLSLPRDQPGKIRFTSLELLQCQKELVNMYLTEDMEWRGLMAHVEKGVVLLISAPDPTPISVSKDRSGPNIITIGPQKARKSIFILDWT